MNFRCESAIDNMTDGSQCPLTFSPWQRVYTLRLERWKSQKSSFPFGQSSPGSFSTSTPRLRIKVIGAGEVRNWTDRGDGVGRRRYS